MKSLDHYAQEKLDTLEASALCRTLIETDRGDFPWVIQNGRRLLSFSCNDYLGLSVHPEVKAAAIAAVGRHGAGAGGSRLVTGNHPLYTALETRLAAAKGTEAACIFGSGYLANAGVMGALAGKNDLILLDERVHACIHAGARLAQAAVKIFRHNDVAHASSLLATHRSEFARALLVTETVFSMDGNRAPLDELAALCAARDVWLMSDDAHGFGLQQQGPQAVVPLQTGTMSKVLGSYGGYLCASEAVIRLVKTRARTLVYSTALPPAPVAAALAALDVMARDPDLIGAPLRKARHFTRRLGLPPAQSPIVPLMTGTPDSALEASRWLADAGFLVTAIRPPTVAPGTARLRFAFCAQHQDHDIARLADVIRDRLAPRGAVEGAAS